jgi:hypothetical protein
MVTTVPDEVASAASGLPIQKFPPVLAIPNDVAAVAVAVPEAVVSLPMPPLTVGDWTLAEPEASIFGFVCTVPLAVGTVANV